MEEQQRWVTKAEAAEELGVSLSTLDRRVKKGEIEVFREGRRVWVLMHGPEYLSDDVLLRRAEVRAEELKRTVAKLEGTISELELRATRLKQERDEAREAESTAWRPYHELERKYRKEVSEHKVTNSVLMVAQIVAFVLLALLIGAVLLWWFVLR